MSLEPKTTAKVLINTSKGPIEVELWAKELPNTTKQFLNKCLNHQYSNLQFLSTDEYLEIINDKEYNLSNESNPRLSCKRGYLGAIKQGNKLSIDAFFISLTELPNFQNYNIFGKIVDGWYNIVKISQVEKDNEGNLVYPVTILGTEVIVPYFDDLEKVETETQVKKVKKQVSLSYDEDEREKEEEEEEENFQIKSGHDIRQPVEKVESKIEENPKSNSESSEFESESEFKSKSESEPENETKYNTEPDASIDSDYDSNLDLNKAESITFEQLQKHSFK
ncbi:unnamed protein product [Candida verbasci]|uniref:PPIase cyclophilin-type domain-containing protein n=1 Tax=Candida verbasci TaxID=1227364 RepID=A0A9W4TX98_9ASCO|nr:unnamed protein product [Candida verbasci]